MTCGGTRTSARYFRRRIPNTKMDSGLISPAGGRLAREVYPVSGSDRRGAYSFPLIAIYAHSLWLFILGLDAYVGALDLYNCVRSR